MYSHIILFNTQTFPFGKQKSDYYLKMVCFENKNAHTCYCFTSTKEALSAESQKQERKHIKSYAKDVNKIKLFLHYISI